MLIKMTLMYLMANLGLWLFLLIAKTMLTSASSFFGSAWEILSWNIFCAVDLCGQS
jgi:hypothetical protein